MSLFFLPIVIGLLILVPFLFHSKRKLKAPILKQELRDALFDLFYHARNAGIMDSKKPFPNVSEFCEDIEGESDEKVSYEKAFALYGQMAKDEATLKAFHRLVIIMINLAMFKKPIKTFLVITFFYLISLVTTGIRAFRSRDTLDESKAFGAAKLYHIRLHP